ncbi:MAG: HAD family phosphatase [Spirochaetaceae bacterium]|nr:HAD family phosphatase [Spirochaetaceae bacterium]
MSKALRYKCLFLDHDDTSVNSTPILHHRAHVEIMKIMRPDTLPLSLDDWFRKNFEPGIMEYLKNDLSMSDEEIRIEYGIWREYAEKTVSDFFPGIIEILIEYRNRGGKVVVVSHSDKDLIERDYKTNGFFGGESFLPDMIFGWTTDATKRKPHPWPVISSLEALGIEAKDSIILDDLKPGILMGKNSGVDAVTAGWGHNIPEIKQYMTANTIAYCSTVEEFRGFLLG